MIARKTGSATRPWNNPNIQMRKNILKKDMNTYDLDVAKSINARSVERPPLNTAGPISVMVLITLSSLLPDLEMKP